MEHNDVTNIYYFDVDIKMDGGSMFECICSHIYVV
jgi:hypothetical protein